MQLSAPSKGYIDTVTELVDFLRSRQVSARHINEITDGLQKSSMSLKVTPHILGMIDWGQIGTDPLRKQFLPFNSEFKKDHPMLRLDSLSEKRSDIGGGIIHRYPGSVLFMIGKTCPAYCAFCTRSYIVGTDAGGIKKDKITSSFRDRLKVLAAYLERMPLVSDVIISGGDIASVSTAVLDAVLNMLLTTATIKTVRLATRGLTFCPVEFDAGSKLYARLCEHQSDFFKCGKELSIQCHFNHSSEINILTEKVVKGLVEAGFVIRNQTVLLKNINSDSSIIRDLIAKLISLNIQPYYVYQMDMVKNAEHFRTTIEESISIYNSVTGFFPGFLSPKFVVDLPGGGGKKNICAYERQESRDGTYAYTSAICGERRLFYYYDPLN